MSIASSGSMYDQQRDITCLTPNRSTQDKKSDMFLHFYELRNFGMSNFWLPRMSFFNYVRQSELTTSVALAHLMVIT